MGHPLVGDRVYGRRHPISTHDDKSGDQLADFPRHALHAEKLSFDHVRSGARMRFSAPLADDMAGLIKDLKNDAMAGEPFRANSSQPVGLTRLGV